MDPNVPTAMRRAVSSAILNAKLDTLVSVLSAGNRAQMDSAMTAHSVPSLMHMDEEVDMLFGMKDNATMTILLLVVNNGEPCIILDADLTSTTLLAAFARQTALQV